MRKAIIGIIALGLVACASFGQPKYISFEVSNGTNTVAAFTQSKNPIGYIDEVYFQAPSAASVTGTVSIVSTPNVGTGMVTTLIYTNTALTAAVKARPRVTQTDSAGADLTSLTVAERFLCNGDPVVFRVLQTSAVTGLTWKAWIKVVQ